MTDEELEQAFEEIREFADPDSQPNPNPKHEVAESGTEEPDEASEMVESVWQDISESSERVQNDASAGSEANPSQDHEPPENASEAPENTTDSNDAPTREECEEALEDLYEKIAA